MDAPTFINTPPLPNSYWVLPGRVLAGEYPGGKNSQATRARLQCLMEAGIECFLDLTEPGELKSYDTQLPFSVEYLRKPIKDHGIPAQRIHMAEILDCLHDTLASGRGVYIHCRAGIGRTGMVVGCFLVERGRSGDDALDELNRLWHQSERSQTWGSIPETDQQIQFVRSWKVTAAHPASPGDDKAAVSMLSAKSSSTPQRGALPEGPDPQLEPGTLSAAGSVRERFHGALLGLAVADAVAAATQYRKPGSFAPVSDMLGGGPFDLPRGGWSDETAMALCLADSLLECNGFNARDQVERYRRWQQEGYLSATGKCVGITASSARAIAMAQWRRQTFSGSHDPAQLDPEPLARVAPAVLFFFGDRDRAIEKAAEAARTTCQAPAVLDACRALARSLHAALSGHPKSVVLDQAALAGHTPEPRRLPGNHPASDAPLWPADTRAPAALAAAVAALRLTDNFRDAILYAANLGGDCDVVAAICGQLAGACYGVSAIPTAWRNDLMRKDLITRYADRLLTRLT